MLLRAPGGHLPPPLTAVLFVALAPLVAPVPTWAQSDGGKRALEIADYALWRTISGSQISHDGRWVAWTYSRVRGDDTLHVKALDSDVVHVITSASAASFSDDGTWVAYFISPPFLEAEKLRRDGETVTRQAGLLELATGETRTWEDAASFGFSDGSSHFYVKKRNTTEPVEVGPGERSRRPSAYAGAVAGQRALSVMERRPPLGVSDRGRPTREPHGVRPCGLHQPGV